MSISAAGQTKNFRCLRTGSSDDYGAVELNVAFTAQPRQQSAVQEGLDCYDTFPSLLYTALPLRSRARWHRPDRGLRVRWILVGYAYLFPVGHLGAELFVDRLVFFKGIALDTVAGGLGCGEFLKTGNVLIIRRRTLGLLRLVGRPLAIRLC